MHAAPPQPAARRARAGAVEPRRHRPADGRRCARRRARTARAAPSAVSRRRSAALDLVLADGSVVHCCSPTDQPELFTAARVGPRRARRRHGGDAAGGAGVPACTRGRGRCRSGRGARRSRRRCVAATTTSSSSGSRTPSVARDQAQQPRPGGDGARTAAALARRGSSDELLGNGGSGLACRIGRAPRPGWSRGSTGASWRACWATGSTSTVSHRVLVSARARAVPGDGVRGAARRRAREALTGHPRASSTPSGLRRDLPGRGALHRRRRHPAVHGVRSRQRLPRRARRTPASRTRSYFRAVESGDARPAAAGRTGASCTPCDAAQLRPRYPRFDEFLALRDAVDPSGGSPTTTSTASSDRAELAPCRPRPAHRARPADAGPAGRARARRGQPRDDGGRAARARLPPARQGAQDAPRSRGRQPRTVTRRSPARRSARSRAWPPPGSATTCCSPTRCSTPAGSARLADGGARVTVAVDSAGDGAPRPSRRRCARSWSTSNVGLPRCGCAPDDAGRLADRGTRRGPGGPRRHGLRGPPDDGARPGRAARRADRGVRWPCCCGRARRRRRRASIAPAAPARTRSTPGRPRSRPARTP